MTFHRTRQRIGTYTSSEILFGAFVIFCLLLILRNADVAVAYMSQGLRLCAHTVIPSLFPFMILSDMIVSGEIGARWLSGLCAPLRRLFRLPTVGCCAVLLGIVCGFPVGAKCAIAAYERGELTRIECEHVIACASNPSSAFVIGAVGLSLWGNRNLGIVLYCTIVAASLLTGIVLARLRYASPTVNVNTNISHIPTRGVKLFTNAVRSSTESMLLICAYVVFFSALTGTLNLILASISVPHIVHVLLTSFFELSSGVGAAALLPNVMLAATFTAATLGWSGLSVHCQLLALCDGRGLSFRIYFTAKLLQALFCAALFTLLLHLIPDLLLSAEPCATDRFYLP